MTVEEPEQIWVADITYIRIEDDFNYLSLITDAYSRLIMGYYLYHSLEAEGSLIALRMALEQRTKAIIIPTGGFRIAAVVMSDYYKEERNARC